MDTTDNTNQKPRRRWLYGIPLVLLLAAAGSILYFEHAEREYEIGITGCESGGIELTDAGIFCGSLRPVARIYARSTCRFSGNLVEDGPAMFSILGPAGTYNIHLGMDDGPIHFLSGSLTIPRGRGDGAFNLSLQAEESTTSLALYKLEQNPADPAAPPLVQVEGNKAENLRLPFGSYLIEERRAPADADESLCTRYYLNVVPRDSANSPADLPDGLEMHKARRVEFLK